ncbi:hypothetical protein V2G26_011110 [Clonostachys chloroleuca]
MKLSTSQDGVAPVVTAAPDDFLTYTNANALYDSHEIREYPRNALDGIFDSLLHLRQSSCKDDQAPCGTGCMPENAECCNGKSYCDEGTECMGTRCRATSSSKTTSTTSSKSSSSAKPTSSSTTSTSSKPTSTSTTSSKPTSSSTTSSKSSSTSSKETSSSSSSSKEESTTASSTSSEESTTASSTDSTTASTATDGDSSTTLSDSIAQIIRTAVPSAAQTDPESACFLATQYTSYYTTPDWYKSMPSNAQSYYSSSANIQASRTSFCTATALAGSDGSNSSDSSKSGGAAPGTIAGAIVGSLVGLALLAVLIFWLIRSGKIKSPFARDLSAEEDPVMAFRGPLDGAGGGSSAPMQQSAYMPLVAAPAAAAVPAASRQVSQSYRSVSPESFVRSSQQGPMNFPVPPSLAAAGGVPYQKRMSSYDTSSSDRQYQPWPGNTPTASMSGDTLNRGSVASQSVFNPPAAYGSAYGAAYLPKDPEPEPEVIPSQSPEPAHEIPPPSPPPVVAAVAPQLPALQLPSDSAAEVPPPPGPPPASAERVHEMEAAQPAASPPPAVTRKAVPSPAPRLD